MIVIYKKKKNGTPQALELRAAPYPYSKMCELCELFVKTAQRFF